MNEQNEVVGILTNDEMGASFQEPWMVKGTEAELIKDVADGIVGEKPVSAIIKNKMREEMFADAVTRVGCRVILRFVETKRPLQELIGEQLYGFIAAELNGNMTEGDVCLHIERLAMKMPQADSADGYCRRIRGSYLTRRVMLTIKDCMAKVRESHDPGMLNEMVSRMVKDIYEYGVTNKVRHEEHLKSLVEEAEAAKEAADRGEDYMPGLRSPFPMLMPFGYLPGLHIIGARPSVGKTSFALELVRYWCKQGVKVGFCTLDMPIREMLRRPISSETGIPATMVMKGKISDEQLARVKETSKTIEEWPWTLTEERDVEALYGWAMMMKMQDKLQVLVVDYLQLMTSGRHTDLYSRITAVSAGLKRIACELQLPVIALSQLSRDSVKGVNKSEEPSMADLRESGAIEQDAYTITLLYRDEKVWGEFEKNPVLDFSPEKESDKGKRAKFAQSFIPIWAKLDKAQNGPTMKIPFLHMARCFRWMPGNYKAPNDQKPALDKFSKMTRTGIYSDFEQNFPADAFAK